MCAMQIVLQTRNVATIDKLVVSLLWLLKSVQYKCRWEGKTYPPKA